jgi:pimeloyl-ACP methyl ester carboxylesterase
MAFSSEQAPKPRNPVIVIPGILGSRLVASESTHSVWGEFGSNFATLKIAANTRLIALPMQQDTPLDKLESSSASDGTLRHVSGTIAGIPIRINTYGSVLDALGVGVEEQGARSGKLWGYHDHVAEESVAFEFDYDWRRSIDENAARLGKFIDEATRFLHLQRGSSDPIKFDIVAHSMGGLIARYFLQYGGQLVPYGGRYPYPNWEGAASVETVIIIGAPNGGSLFALERLVIGMPKSRITPGYDPVVLGTMPSVYQLLPRIRHKTFARQENQEASADYMNVDFWQEMGWGLAAPGVDDKLSVLLPGIDSVRQRQQTAIDHLDKCLRAAQAVHLALDTVTRRPENLFMHLIAGDATPTLLLASAKRGDRRLQVDQRGAGDGTVSRASALLDERVGGKWVPRIVSPLKWDSIMYLSSNHLGLTRDPVATRNILHLLYQKPLERL